MPSSIWKTFLISLTLVFAMSSAGRAAQLFTGRWHNSEGQPVSIGVVQDGETVALFSEAGWAMLLLAPDSGGMLASGQGKWSFNDSSSATVDVTIGYRDDRLYLSIVSKDESGHSAYKIILDRIELRLPNRRI
ncbi:hypothetical protein [Rhizobium sp. C1]|uniref:hypothetical protein n=1 Tax=Rhizobium sp. C1 TaxID=1349799 RepID=UPI001E3BE4C4|nr:hypothetical protein [Rhizobium sp. C1]MCD2177233.1 hypothetical protein [Rhizobium sp. C1]